MVRMTSLLETTDADQPGAHSWVRKALGIAMEGEQTNYIWGVIDIIPHTNFPDIRNKSVIHSENGSCMIIPREEDKVRLYIQLSEKDNVYDFATGRIDKSRFGPRKILEVISCSTCCDLWLTIPSHVRSLGKLSPRTSSKILNHLTGGPST